MSGFGSGFGGGGHGGGSGTITEITSDDSSVTIVDPEGPVTDLSVSGGGAFIPLATVTAAGDLIVATGDAAVTNLPVGTDGDVLTLVTGEPAWAAGGGGGDFVPIGDPTMIATGSTVLSLSADAVAWTEFPANTSAMAFGLAGDSFPRVVFDGQGDVYFGDGTVDPTTGAGSILQNGALIGFTSVEGVGLQTTGAGASGISLDDTGSGGGGVTITSDNGPVQITAANGLGLVDDSTTGIGLVESGAGPITLTAGTLASGSLYFYGSTSGEPSTTGDPVGAIAIDSTTPGLWLLTVTGNPDTWVNLLDPLTFSDAINTGASQTSGALLATVLTTGTGQQIDTTHDRETVSNVTFNSTVGAAATCLVELSPDGTTYSTLVTETEPVGVALAGTVRGVHVRVPAGWYVRLTVTNAVLGATIYY